MISQRYRLERQLGQGGMGEVWLARHLQLDSAVAIKLLVSEHAATPGARARFEREARAAAQVKSPHIVHVFDYGVDDETPYLVMEVLEGEDLETRLRRAGRLTPAETARLIAPLCKALRRIHDAGLVHRDLKPSNVYLARHDDEDHVKILDFGIAKTTRPTKASDVTTTGIVVGSPPYMSPEHILAKKELDHRTDLWAVGVIAFRALTGRLPFAAEVMTQLLVEICTAPVPLVSTLDVGLGPAWDEFFAQALAREPDQRFQTASELAEAFAALARDAPLAASRAPHEPSASADASAATLANVSPTTDELSATLENVAPRSEKTSPRSETTSPASETTSPTSETASPTPKSLSGEGERVSGAGEGLAAAGEGVFAAEDAPSPAVEPAPARRRKGDSVVPAVLIGVVAAGLLVWAASAFSTGDASAPPVAAAASSGAPARPQVTSGPTLANPSPPPASDTASPGVARSSQTSQASSPSSPSPSPSSPSPTAGPSPSVNTLPPSRTAPSESTAAPTPPQQQAPSPEPPAAPAPSDSAKKRELW